MSGETIRQSCAELATAEAHIRAAVEIFGPSGDPLDERNLGARYLRGALAIIRKVSNDLTAEEDPDAFDLRGSDAATWTPPAAPGEPVGDPIGEALDEYAQRVERLEESLDRIAEKLRGVR